MLLILLSILFTTVSMCGSDVPDSAVLSGHNYLVHVTGLCSSGISCLSLIPCLLIPRQLLILCFIDLVPSWKPQTRFDVFLFELDYVNMDIEEEASASDREQSKNPHQNQHPTPSRWPGMPGWRVTFRGGREQLPS
jgi:hypothetical protein